MFRKTVLLILVLMVVAVAGCSEVGRAIGGVLPYHEESFQVRPSSERVVSLELGAGDSLEGYVQVISGGNLDVRFWVTDPYGRVIYGSLMVKGRHDFIFKASVGGYYTLHFDNGFSLITSKGVILKYRKIVS